VQPKNMINFSQQNNKFWQYALMLCFLLTSAVAVSAQSPTCQTATPLCDNISPYPASTNRPDAPAGNDYGCLGSQPNPAWFYFTISQAGTISLPLQNSAVVDVDFILYGPFPGSAAAISQCGNMGNGGPGGNIIDCSYDPQAFEVIDIPNALPGQVYVLLVTNFSNTPTNIFTQPNTGTGRLACPCRIDATHSLTPVANNNGSLISTIDSAAQYGVCPNDSLFFTLGMRGENIADSLGLEVAGTTIGNVFGTSEFAIFGPFYPIPGRFDTMELIVGIFPTQATAGIRNFNLGITSINRITRIICPEIAPVSVIIPGLVANDTTACSGQDLQLRANSLPSTTFGSPSYNWTQISGQALPITAANTATPTINIVPQLSTSSANPAVFVVENTYGTCVMRDTVTVSFPDVSLNLAPNPMGTCGGTTAQIFARLSDTLNFTNACLPSYTLTSIPFAPQAGAGTSVTLADEQMSTALPIGFPFRFFCNNYNNFYISSNGFITFNAGQQPSSANVAIPNTAQPNNLIALAWDDLNPSAGTGSVQYFVTGTAPNRRLVVSFSNVRYYALFGTTRSVSTQLVLYETTNVIEMHVTRIDNNGSNMTMGIENAAGSSGLFISGRNNESFSSSNEGFRFTPVPGPAIPLSPTYSWTPSNTLSSSTIFNPIATPNGNTNYTVTVTDGACRYSGEVTVVVASMGVGATLTQPSCASPNSGIITTNANGGVAPLNYLWSNGRTSPNLTGIAAGTFTLTVTDANGCTGTTSGTITPANAPTFSSVINNVTCSGNGSISLTVNTGQPPFTFVWNNGATTANISGLNAGLYQASITDATGCTAITPFLQVGVSNATVRANIASLGNVTCAGANDGFININVVGGTAPYTYNWNNGATTQNLSGLGAGTYRMTLTDANGCSATSASVLLIEPSAISMAVVTVVPPTCNGEATGRITISNSGGTSPYTYNWSNGNATQNNLNITAGVYAVTLTDANGCTATLQNISVSEPSAITVTNVRSSPVFCAGGNDGTITVAANGGNNPNFNFVWSHGVATTFNSVTGLSAGVYSVTATDGNGCIGILSGISITEPASATVTAAPIVAPTCNGGTNGSINSNIAGGTAPYTYLWSNGRTTANITGIAAGTYAVTVTDANSCTVSLSNISVSQPDAISITVVSVTPASCGTANGAIDITASSGTAPYTYLWSNTSTTEDINTLAVGTYTVTVSDNNGCTVSQAINVNNTSTLTASLSAITNVSCVGNSNGAITMQVSGGTAPVTFAWNTGATTQNISALAPNTNYQLTITDGLGCATILGTYTVTEPSSISLTAAATNATCNGSNTGSIALSASGGTANYTFVWSNGRTSQNISGIAAGTYSVTLTDANGCTNSLANISVGEPSALSLTLATATNPACTGVNNGSIDMSSGGGTAPYRFVWSNGQTTEDLTALAPNVYSLTLTDANNCTISASAITLTTTNVVTLTLASSSNANCAGGSDGSINIQTLGGTPNYSYIWSNGTSSQNLTGISAGTYSLTATDAIGCVGTITNLSISAPAAITLTIDGQITTIGCDLAPTGRLNAIATGGTPNFTYLWSNGATDALNNNLPAGNFALTVSDANGCTASNNASIGEPVLPTVNAFIDQQGTTDTCIFLGYTAQLNAGSSSNSSYVWTALSQTSTAGISNPNQAVTDITPTAAGDYILLLTSSNTTNGVTCTVTDTLTLCIEAQIFGGLPTAFTPNGDGENDKFRPVGLDAQYIQTFTIFNRWGQKLYDDATLTDGGWDGTWKGVDQPREVYIVILTYQFPQDPNPIMLRGEFTLLR
jgi:gliding motility-associated-like protein